MPPTTSRSTTDDDALGRYITVFAGDGATGAAFVCVEHRVDRLVVEALLPGRSLPGGGGRVSCLSRVGQWDSQASVGPDGRITLTIPPWVARATARQAVRVPVGAATTLLTDAERWPARVVDLSVTGAAVAVESAAAVEVGRQLTCVLPRGRAGAQVMSVRPHEHPLLEVLGMRWRSLDPPAQGWVRDTVTETRRALQP